MTIEKYIAKIFNLKGDILMIGLWKLEVNLTIIGTITVYLSKMWFLDRMVWVHEDMKICTQ